MKFSKSFTILPIFLALASSVAIAEESGAFIGVGLGRGAAEAKAADVQNVEKTSVYEASYEIIAGYKSFFTPNFGLRYYGNFTYADFRNHNPGKSNLMNYGVNVDALYNFIASEESNFGAFVGVGVGGNTLNDDGFDEIEAMGIKLKKTGLDVALNVGLRSIIDSKHSLEAIVRVPFIDLTLFDKNQEKLTFSRHYNIGVRYIFNF